MEFRQIKYFLAVCDCLNFTRAAEKSAVSQPALTVAIKKLEDELGGPLFTRDGRSVSITALGAEMRSHMAQIAVTRDLAYAAAKEITSGADRDINLGVTYTISANLVQRIVAAWRQIRPTSRIILHDIETSAYQELLTSRAIDAALVSVSASSPRMFDCITVAPDPFVLAMAHDHPLARYNIVPLSQLAATPYIDRLRCNFRENVMGIADTNNVKLDIIIQSAREDWLLELIAAGVGVSFMSEGIATHANVTTRPVACIEFPRTIEFVTLAQHEDRRLLDDLGQAVRVISESGETGYRQS